jgi:hypothetical protein
MLSAKRLSLIAVASLLLVGAGCGSSTTTGTPTGPGSAAVTGNGAPGAGTAPEAVSPPATGRTKTVNLAAVAKSGESGYATFTDVGDNETKVTIRMTGAPKDVAQPAAIMLNDCATAAGDKKYELPLIIDGKADTTLGAKFSDLFPAGAINFSLRVKKDAVQTTGETYAACGNLQG